MCTGMTYQDDAGRWYLARTMDFDVALDAAPVIVPRHHRFTAAAAPEGFAGPHGFVGAGRLIDGLVMLDGVNSAGLAATAQYLTESKATVSPVPGKRNLAAYEVIAYLLGHCASAAEVKASLAGLNVVRVTNALLGHPVPLHWLVADRTGACGVIEQTEAGLTYYDNPVGVMTNSPQFPWHLQNLGNYPHLTNRVAPSREYGTLTASGAGAAGTGAVGLPGDYTSVSRFVRAAFVRQHLAPATDAIVALGHALAPFDQAADVKLMADGRPEVTQYRAYLDLAASTYYFQAYAATRLTRVRLTESALAAGAPTFVAVDEHPVVVAVN
ncbi:linear amide C-N hydrolase [Lacticaseibacillus kribbianus]|uniref:linear amide C-N hydrolase n=1 Tax=Lacticaseibacillus kribbianus TaxID=2926292 RepID=UPI001CD33A0F|nr:linear amide C-N hydrolase [Lacticaseibacillus kribbianus]